MRLYHRKQLLALALAAIPIACAFQAHYPRGSVVGKRPLREPLVLYSSGDHHQDGPCGKKDIPTSSGRNDGIAISQSLPAAFAGVLLAITTFLSVPAYGVDDSLIVSESSSSPQQTTANVRAGLSARRYWNIMASQEDNAQELRAQANEGLVDYAVGTVNTMYYDNTGGARFTPREFYNRWRALRDETRKEQTLSSRDATVDKLKMLIGTLNDPYSKYLTREELWQELNVRNDGFLGIGAVVEAPDQGDQFFARGSAPTLATIVDGASNNNNNVRQPQSAAGGKKESPAPLSAMAVRDLPVVTAVVPDSPAERSGITVGDRIVAVGEYTFLGQSRKDVNHNFQERFGDTSGAGYFGHSDVTLAKPVVRTLLAEDTQSSVSMSSSRSSNSRDREVVIGYRQTRVRLPTKSIEEETYNTQQDQATAAATTSYVASGMSGMESDSPAVQQSAAAEAPTTNLPTKGGNSIVHWELISGQSPQPSIFQRSLMAATTDDNTDEQERKVGYIRLTRFSKASTAGYIEAVQALEDLGATSFIIDVRNNYGGIIQEAMLTASTLLRDPHAVLCYTMNARGGFTPHDVEEYVVDKRYPGYLMTKEPRWVTLRQSQRENPAMYDDNGSNWVPPSSYASLREQTAKRGLHRPSTSSAYRYEVDNTNVADSAASLPFNLQWNTAAANAYLNHNQQWMAQRNVVILINEGTASSAEVFASSLHDNGRTLALIGTKSYGKGLIQHTFPMPDGGGLRLTVAEYLTPALRHVTVVGNAKFDRTTGEQVGGGITPDLYCASKQGIPANIGADLCVGMALDVLEEAESTSYSSQGQEKHHRQQHLKERQQQEDFSKKGILALGSPSAADISRDSPMTRASLTSNDAVPEQAVKADSE